VGSKSILRDKLLLLTRYICHKIVINGHTNKIIFSFQGHKFILCPLTPQHVREDEIKLKAKINSENENKKN